jgi:hypothetical protein
LLSVFVCMSLTLHALSLSTAPPLSVSCCVWEVPALRHLSTLRYSASLFALYAAKTLQKRKG